MLRVSMSLTVFPSSLKLTRRLISTGNQPSDLIRRALGEADRGELVSATLIDPGRGYSDPTPPLVTVSIPDAGDQTARVRAELKCTGKVARIELDSGGGGYTFSPAVSISVVL